MMFSHFSTFKIFEQLYESRVSKPDDQPLFLADERYINLEAAVSIDHICERLPALRVGTSIAICVFCFKNVYQFMQLQ